MPAINPTLSTFNGVSPPWSLANLDANFAAIAAVVNSINTYEQYAADTGSANIYVVAYAAGTIFTLSAGVGVTFRVTNANTGASTLAAGGTAAKNIVNPDGSALTAGQLSAGTIAKCVYDGTSYQLISVSSTTTSIAAIARSGRLTLTTGVPVTTSDVTGATTVYFTPYSGNFTEISQATTDATKSPAAVANNSNYDVFLWSDAGTLRATRGPLWTSDTARGAGAGTTELQFVSGNWTNKVAITNGPGANAGIYVGSIRSDGSAQINDSFAKRHVWNNYNRAVRPMKVVDTTDTWAYNTAAFRQANGSAANQLDFLVGLLEDAVAANAMGCAIGPDATARNVFTGIGIDSTTVNSASISPISAIISSAQVSMMASYKGFPGLGRHFLAWLEYSTGVATTTWYGDNSGTLMQSGIIGEIRA